MKTSSRHSRRLRNPKHQENRKEPFFSPASETVQTKEETPFFQSKLNIGRPGDKYEQEADKMADAVVHGSDEAPQVQRKDISGIQRYMTNAEYDERGTNTERIEEDKRVQEKPELQAMEEEEAQMQEEEEEAQMQEEEEEAQMQEEEEEAQMQEEEEEAQMQEEEEEAQMQEEEEEAQMQEEEEEAQMQEEEEEAQMQQEEEEAQMQEEEEEAQMQEEEEEAQMQAEEEEAQMQQEEEVQTKGNARPSVAGPQFTREVKQAKGKGQKLPERTRSEMEKAFGVDFGAVRVHDDQGAADLNKQLRAQAFTTGKDIFFNEGKYSPESGSGKLLLAHELTHVIQQGHAAPLQDQSKKKDAATVKVSGKEREKNASPLSGGQGGTLQARFLKDDDPAPGNGPDPEATEIDWWKGNPYLRDDKGNWQRVSREVVNNQRGERGANHQVVPGHLREGARKACRQGKTKLFRVSQSDQFLLVVYNYGMVVTAYYMSGNEAKRELLGSGGTEAMWNARKEQLPTVG